MACKGICIRHKASGRYASGNKGCRVCDLFIKWDGVSCPSCGSRLRMGPRRFKFEDKLRKQQKEKQIQEAKNNITLSIQQALRKKFDSLLLY